MVYPDSVFIAGANRGIGLGLVKEFLKVPAVEHVIAGTRKPDDAKELKSIIDSRLKIVKIDTGCDQSINDACAQVEKIVGENGLNLIVNNAGILPRYFTSGAVSRETLMKCLNVNTLGTAIVSQGAAQQSGDHLGVDRAAIVNISTSWASISQNRGWFWCTRNSGVQNKQVRRKSAGHDNGRRPRGLQDTCGSVLSWLGEDRNGKYVWTKLQLKSQLQHWLNRYRSWGSNIMEGFLIVTLE